MADIDNLQIKINASARGANQQLDKLVDKMLKLRASIAGVDGANFNTLATGIQNFARAAAGLNQVKTADFTRLTKNLNQLANIRKGELNRAATSLQNMSKALSGIDFGNSATQLADLGKGISKLGGKNATAAIDNMPKMATALRQMIEELAKAPQMSNNVVRMTQALGTLAGRAGGVRTVANSFNQLRSSGTRTSSLMKSFTSNLHNFTSGLGRASNSSKSLAHYLGTMYANLWILRRGFTALKDAVVSSMDYIEEYNYYNTTWDKVGTEWSNQWKQYGYDSAEAYADSFENRMNSLSSKMTGYSVNDDGTLSSTNTKSLGLDTTQLMNYSAGIAQLTNSLGLTGEATETVSQGMSMLAGDMSSFKNVDLETVMNNFQSGLIGQSRALYKYGIDITNATLQQYAYDAGIKKSVTEMTQGEKMQLRMIAILDQSKVAYGDLAKTINSPSNQLRMLQNNFTQLSRTIGNIFLPVVAKVLPYVNGLVIAIRRLFEWTASMLGIDLSDIIGNSGSGYSDAFDDLEDDADDATDAIDGTTEATKKLAKQLMGFDELNNITTSTTSSSSSSSDSDDGTVDLTDALADALSDYQDVWNKAYNDMTDNATEFADKLTNLFKSAWQSGDGSDIGSAIASWLNKGINWFNNNSGKISDGCSKIATLLATTVNGFVSTLKWAGLGTAIGTSLKTFFDTETTFFDKVSWVNFGSCLATSLNSAVDSGVIESYFTSMASKLKAAIELAFGAITTFDFENLGTAIGQGINDFFDKMNIVDENTNLNGWQELGASVGGSVHGFVSAITAALNKIKPKEISDALAALFNSAAEEIDETDWEALGKSLVDFFAHINYADILSGAANLIGSVAKGIFEMLKSALSEDIYYLKEYLPQWIEKLGTYTLALDVSLAEKAVDFGVKVAKFVTEIPGKSIGLAVSIMTTIAEFTQKLASFSENLPTLTKKLTIIIGTKLATLKKKIDAFLENLPSNSIKLAIEIGLTAVAMRKRMEKFLGSVGVSSLKIAISIGTTVATLSNSITKLAKNVIKSVGVLFKFKAKLEFSAIKSAIKLIVSWINSYVIGAINKISVKIPKWVPTMGGKTFGFNLSKISLPSGFANGGFPTTGQYFLARESGPELVGTVGNKTAVANNSQIVQSVSSGVSDAVYNAMAPVLTSLCNSMNTMSASLGDGSGDVSVEVDGDSILRVVRKSNNSYKKSHGKSALS